MSEDIKIFRIIYRINSILFLLLLAYGAYFVIGAIVPSDDPWARGTVEVVEDPALDQSPIVELRFDSLTRVRGSNTRYTLLETQSSGGKFSGYSPSETRNVLFISDPNFESNWLFDHHRYRLLSVTALEIDDEVDEEHPAVALYMDVVKEDTNGDGSLTEDDLHTIALLRPNGREYTEVLDSAEQIVSKSSHPDGSTLDVLIRNGNELILKRYSLTSFDQELERVVAVLQ